MAKELQMEANFANEKNMANGMISRRFFTGSGYRFHGGPGRKRFGDAGIRDSEKSLERRNHVRLQIHKEAFAFIRDRRFQPIRIKGAGMGEIAAAVFRCRPVCMGPVTDLSLGGLAFRHVDELELNPVHAYVLDILIADRGLYLADLSFRVVSDVEADDDFLLDPLATRRLGVQFENFSSRQFAGLNDLIRSFSYLKMRESEQCKKKI
jgi:hypothetical protein